MKKVIDKTPTSVTRMIRDDSDESGRYYFHEVEFDDHILHNNKRRRLEGITEVGQRVPGLPEGTTVIQSFQVPPKQWARFQRDHKDIIRGLTHRDEAERIKAARRMAILHPEWVTTAGNR